MYNLTPTQMNLSFKCHPWKHKWCLVWPPEVCDCNNDEYGGVVDLYCQSRWAKQKHRAHISRKYTMLRVFIHQERVPLRGLDNSCLRQGMKTELFISKILSAATLCSRNSPLRRSETSFHIKRCQGVILLYICITNNGSFRCEIFSMPNSEC